MYIKLNQLLASSVEERMQFVKENPSFLDEMFAHIGHSNGELRDQLNYRLFMEMISADQLPHAVLKQWATDLSEQLKVEGDVFLRSFSALWLTAIVYADRQVQVVDAQQYERIVVAATNLLMKENDLRSFIDEEQGWAHSIAHVTDLLTACVAHPMFTMKYAAPMLQALKIVSWKGTVFVDDEEERFVRLVMALLNAGLPEDLFIEWLEQVFDRLEQMMYAEGYTSAWFKGRTNIMHFAKHLYFVLKFSQQEKLRGITSILIQKWLR